MRTRTLLAGAAVAALALAPLRSGYSMGTKPEPPPTSPSSSPSDAPQGTDAAASSGARQEAERSYALAYDDLAKARKDADSGNKKSSEKRYRKALERVEKAVALDSSYAEAWNLVGYAARRLGDYDKSFAAYERCLAIKPDLAAAHEYLGEAWLEKGDLQKSRAQLAILEQANPQSEEAKALRAAIATYVTAHPQAADTSTAPADSAEAHAGH